MQPTRRQAIALMLALPALGAAGTAAGQTGAVWSARQTQDALVQDRARLLDIRSRGEWRDTGLARGAWPVSLHEEGFARRLFAARDLAAGRPVALICATGGRSGSVMQALGGAGETGFVDVPEGMLGSPAGPGWIAAGLLVVSMQEALENLPQVLS